MQAAAAESTFVVPKRLSSRVIEAASPLSTPIPAKPSEHQSKPALSLTTHLDHASPRTEARTSSSAPSQMAVTTDMLKSTERPHPPAGTPTPGSFRRSHSHHHVPFRETTSDMDTMAPPARQPEDSSDTVGFPSAFTASARVETTPAAFAVAHTSKNDEGFDKHGLFSARCPSADPLNTASVEIDAEVAVASPLGSDSLGLQAFILRPPSLFAAPSEGDPQSSSDATMILNSIEQDFSASVKSVEQVSAPSPPPSSMSQPEMPKPQPGLLSPVMPTESALKWEATHAFVPSGPARGAGAHLRTPFTSVASQGSRTPPALRPNTSPPSRTPPKSPAGTPPRTPPTERTPKPNTKPASRPVLTPTMSPAPKSTPRATKAPNGDPAKLQADPSAASPASRTPVPARLANKRNQRDLAAVDPRQTVRAQQRAIIYALNAVMAEHERQQFEQFMARHRGQAYEPEDGSDSSFESTDSEEDAK
eukprot:m.920187 g.920187  ORF g.920187 m.920187 type:complete len:477 (+) comp61909_c0_seq1:635-2065(+)